MIRIRIEFPDRRYTAVTDTSGVGVGVTSEWPPSPYRLAAALLAGIMTLPEPDQAVAYRALERVTAAEPPTIWTPEEDEWTNLPDRWKPSSLSAPEGKHHPHGITIGPNGPERTNKAVFTGAERILHGDVLVDIPVNLTREEVDALNRATLRVPYFGRSTHPAILTVTTTDGAPLPGHTRWTPGGSTMVTGWTPGTLNWLKFRHERQQDGQGDVPTPSRDTSGGAVKVGYRAARQRVDGAVRLLRLASPLRPSAAEQLITRLNGEVPAAAFPLADVAHPYAEGLIRGLGVHGQDEEETDRSALQVETLTEVTHLNLTNPAYLREDHWIGPSRGWLSATPAVSHSSELAATLLLTEQLAEVTGVEPRVALSRQPFIAGQVLWPRPGRGRRQWFVAVTFPTPVAGPLRCGTRTDAGYGLLLPA